MRRSISMNWLRGAVMLFAFALAVFATGAQARADDYYAGKTIRVIVPFTAGGTFDTLARIVANHMPRFVPGEPTMIVENLPGGGLMIGARAAYTAKPDGLTMIHLPSMAVTEDLLKGHADIEFSEFKWLGSVSGSSYSVMLRTELADQSIDDLRANQTPIKLGVDGPGGLIYITSKLTRELSGLNVQLVGGFQGAAPIMLSIKQGEIDGIVGGVEVLLANALASEMYQAGELKPALLLGGSVPPAELEASISALPKMSDFVPEGDDLKVFDALIDLVSITRLFGSAPATPEDHLAILRDAFAAMVKDPEFTTDIEKVGFDSDPVLADEVTRIMETLAGLEPPVVERLRAILE